jgi:hypothetical protein
MSEKLIKNPKRKTILCVGIILVCFVCVFIRIGLVERARGKTIVSFVEEWAKFGKPVTIEKIVVRNVPVYAKITVRAVADKRAKGYVTGDIQEKLQVGQEVFCSGKIEPCGKTKTIARELDMDTGLFPVEIDLNFSQGLGDSAVVFVCTSTLPNTMVAPNEVLDNSGGQYYLWKVESGKAKKVKVKIGSRNGYGTAIVEGIIPGDLVVSNGRNLLSENDGVNIVSDEATQEFNIEGSAL